MSGPQFFQTRMGQVFFEGTMPRLYRAIESLVDAIKPANAEYRFIKAALPHEDIDIQINEYAESGFRVIAATDRWIVLERRFQKPEPNSVPGDPAE